MTLTEKNAVKILEKGLLKLDNISYDSIDKLMRGIMKDYDMTAKQLHNAFVDKHNKTPDDWIKEKLNEGTLHHWFKGSKSKKGKPGWVQADGSPCANEPGETKTPKCFSSARLAALKRKGKKGKSLIRSAIRRKREKDASQQEKSGGAKPTNVPTFAKGKKDPNYIKAEPAIKEEMKLNEAQKDSPGKGSGKKDACYHKVKSRYDVWPSAYASGALVKCRKVGAKNWGTKSEEIEMQRYCPKCKKNEKQSECKYGPRFWATYSTPITLTSNQMKYNIAQVHPANEEKDHEYSMARSQLSTVMNAVKRLKKKMKGEGNIEAWVQSKITKAADYLDAAADYIDSGEHDVGESISIEDLNGNSFAEVVDIIGPNQMEPIVDEGCWKGYKQIGMKKKGDKVVPNCVKEGYSNWREELFEDWQSVNRKDKTDGLSQKAVDAYRRENPGSKLQTAVTEKKPTGKRAKRRSSFCSRMKGHKAKNTSAKTARDPDSRINKALRRWNCN
jgi:hypothetical protein